MNIFKCKQSFVLFLLLILGCTIFAVRAGTGKRSLFVGNPILFDDNYLSGSDNLLVAVQSGPMNTKPRVSSNVQHFPIDILVLP